MSNILNLFDAVTKNFIESFAPVVDQIFSEFDNQVSLNEYSEEKLDSLLESVISSFPRSHYTYNRIIEKLTSFSVTNPHSIIKNLCKKFKTETNRSNESEPVLISINSHSYNQANFHHFMFLHYINLIFLSDLIFKIMTTYKLNNSISKIVSCGYNLCTSSKRLGKLQDMLVDTWSFIFYHVSLIELDDIIKSFDNVFDQSNSARVLRIISRIKGNSKFAESLLYQVINAKKKKWLTSEMLTQLSILLSHINCDKGVLKEFFKMSWEDRADDDLKYGSIDMICVLFNRLHQDEKKVQHFYSSRIYKHSHNDSKVERCLRAFLSLIRGDITKVSGAGDGTDPLAFISSTTAGKKYTVTIDSFFSTFIKVFFYKSNFTVCPVLFRDVLVHLASLDIDQFNNFVVPKFTALERNDPRFAVLLMTIPLLNRKAFLEKSYCKAKKEKINEINEKIHSITIGLLDILEKTSNQMTRAVIFDSIQIQTDIEESDKHVNSFLIQNNYPLFEKNPNRLNMTLLPGNQYSIVLHMLGCIFVTFTDDDFKKHPQLINIIIEFSCSDDQLISEMATNICQNRLNSAAIQSLFIQEALKNIYSINSPELICRTLQFIFYSLSHLTFKASERTYRKIEAAVISCFTLDQPLCRALAFKIFKQIGVIGKSHSYTYLNESNSIIIDNVKLMMIVLHVPEKPSIAAPPIGSVSFESACHTRYCYFWLLYLSEFMNILLDNKCTKLINKILDYIEPWIEKIPKLIERNKISPVTATAIYIFYIDSLTRCSETSDFQKEHSEKSNSSKKKSSKKSKKHCEFSKIEKLCNNVIQSKSQKTKKAFIKSFSYLNYRSIPAALPCVLSADKDLYPEIAEALTVIIQNPENFNKILKNLFGITISMLNNFQNYFTDLQINSQKDIKWKKETLQKLKQNQEICINYCILISATFNNIHVCIPEEEWPITSRQLHVQFLLHWGQLPKEFKKLKSYAINALIPILNSGTVFTNGYSFELPMLDMLLQCQLSGFPVLESLLFFHMDVLLKEFIKRVFVNPRRESQVYLAAIIGALDKLDNGKIINDLVGSLILLAKHCFENKNESWRFILEKLVLLLIDPNQEGETFKMIDRATDMSFVNTVFLFFIEQIIDFAFELIGETKKIIVVKTVIGYISPWISMFRILPTQNNIIPGVPARFRKFTVISFFDRIIALSNALSNEQYDAFSQIWYDLLKSSETNVSILLLLFESFDNDESYDETSSEKEFINIKPESIKQKIFSELLDNSPVIISKFLAKRCSFSYWYFSTTQRKIQPRSQNWMIKVLTRSFVDYTVESAPNFTLAFHFSLLFIEDAEDLFEALVAVFNLESVDAEYVWTLDADSENTMRASSIITNFVEQFKDENPKAIRKWSLEAMRWVVGCKDLKIAYRSLVILNSLNYFLNPAFPKLLADAVKYHLLNVVDNQFDEIALFVGEAFTLLTNHLNEPAISDFAFRFASSFLHFRPFFKSYCLGNAMPIFMDCISNPILAKSAKMIIVDAFIPFAHSLELNKNAQEILLSITQKVESPELFIVAAAFLIKPLPFVNIGKTYKEIMNASYSKEVINRALMIFSAMLKNASKPLADSIFIVVTQLFKKYDISINRIQLVPIYQNALKSIAVMESASDFVQAIARMDPDIASMSDAILPNTKTINDVANNLSSINTRNNNSNNGIVPITNCKNLQQLEGIIDQLNPPKIIPYATQDEMITGLKNDSSKARNRKVSITNIPTILSSALLMSSGVILSPRTIIPAAFQHNSNSKIQLAPLVNKKVIHRLLNFSKSHQNKKFNFVVSLREFIDLERPA